MSSANERFAKSMLVSDLQSGLDLIASLSLADSEAANIRINRFLDSLLRAPPDAEIYLCLLERLPPIVAAVMGELGKRFVGKALPLAEKEETSFQEVVLTWLKVVRAYTHCAQIDSAKSGAQNPQRMALILHRCIYFTGLVIGEHYRAKRELVPSLWLKLHGYYAKAEEWGVTNRNVAGCLEQSGPSINCTAAFLAPLLLELSGPYALSLQDLKWVLALAHHWSSLVFLRTAEAEQALPPFMIDLGQDIALCPSLEGRRRRDFRLLDLSRLGLRLKQVRQQLNEGMPPDQLGLGSAVSAAQCKRLLDTLADPWSLSPKSRGFSRHQAVGTAKLDMGFPEMHYHISGKDFEQSASAKAYSRREIEAILTFRHRTDPGLPLQILPEGLNFKPDEWQVINQSAQGFRLMRTCLGRRLKHGQLISVCPHDGERFLLAQITWLMQERSGGLVAGVALLPGIPQAIAVRPLAQQAGNLELFSRAFLLPAVRAVGAEQSLVLPRGWFKPHHIVEIDSAGESDELWSARMVSMVSDGVDFERVGFSVVT